MPITGPHCRSCLPHRAWCLKALHACQRMLTAGAKLEREMVEPPTHDPRASKLFDPKVFPPSPETPRWLALLAQIRKLCHQRKNSLLLTCQKLCDKIISAPAALQDFPALTAPPLLTLPAVCGRTAPEVRCSVCPPISTEFCRLPLLPPPTKSDGNSCHRVPLREVMQCCIQPPLIHNGWTVTL